MNTSPFGPNSPPAAALRGSTASMPASKRSANSWLHTFSAKRGRRVQMRGPSALSSSEAMTSMTPPSTRMAIG